MRVVFSRYSVEGLRRREISDVQVRQSPWVDSGQSTLKECVTIMIMFD